MEIEHLFRADDSLKSSRCSKLQPSDYEIFLPADFDNAKRRLRRYFSPSLRAPTLQPPNKARAERRSYPNPYRRDTLPMPLMRTLPRPPWRTLTRDYTASPLYRTHTLPQIPNQTLAAIARENPSHRPRCFWANSNLSGFHPRYLNQESTTGRNPP